MLFLTEYLLQGDSDVVSLRIAKPVHPDSSDEAEVVHTTADNDDSSNLTDSNEASSSVLGSKAVHI